MKRFFWCVSCALFLLVLVPGTKVIAIEPTEAPHIIPLPTGAVTIHNGLINEKIDTTEDAQANSPEEVPSGTPPPPSTYTGSVPKIDVNTDNFKIPKLDAIADWLINTTRFMNTKNIQDNLIPHQNNLYISGQARRCITYAGIKIPDQIGDKYKTERISYLPTLITATELLSAQTVRNSISPINEEYNFEGPSYELDNAPPCDTAEGVGTAQEPKQIMLAQGQGNNFIAWVKTLLEKFTVKSVFISKQLTPEAERIHCLLNGCVNDGTDLSYMDNQKKQETVQKSGGIADAYRTITMDTTKGQSANGQEQNFTKTNTFGTKQMENSANLIKCSLIPPSQRAKLGLTNQCSGFVAQTPTSCLTSSLPELTVKSECKLKSGSINGYTLSPKLVETIEAAASAYNVPASLMLGIMFGEGAFNGNKVFSSSSVDTYLDGCTLLPTCDPNSSREYTNIVPFIPSDWPDVKDAVKIIDPNRTSNPCNLVDGIFALAQGLHRFQYAPAFAGKTCFGISLVSGSAGMATTCSWSDNSAESAIRFWEIGGAWNDTTRSCATQIGTCSSGGGGTVSGLQCATGGDTCDRIDNRKTPKSHNGCIWDVYKSN